MPGQGLDPVDSSLHFCLISGMFGRGEIGRTLCDLPVAARSSGCYEGALRRFLNASGCQEPTNRSSSEWPAFATANSSGYIPFGPESYLLARQRSGLNVAYKDGGSPGLRPFSGSFDESEFKSLYGNNVKINGGASPGPALRAGGVLTNAEAVLNPIFNRRVQSLVEMIDSAGLDDIWTSEHEGTSIFLTYMKRKREPVTDAKYATKIRTYFEGDAVAQCVLGGYLQYLIAPVKSGIERLPEQILEEETKSREEGRAYQMVAAANYAIGSGVLNGGAQEVSTAMQALSSMKVYGGFILGDTLLLALALIRLSPTGKDYEFSGYFTPDVECSDRRISSKFAQCVGPILLHLAGYSYKKIKKQLLLIEAESSLASHPRQWKPHSHFVSHC